jgi:hypothetical protein
MSVQYAAVDNDSSPYVIITKRKKRKEKQKTNQG